MTELIRLTVNHLAIIVFLSSMAGFSISTLVLKYYFTKRRSRKMSPSEADMMRLADYINENHPDYVQAGSPADIAIRLIDILHKKKSEL